MVNHLAKFVQSQYGMEGMRVVYLYTSHIKLKIKINVDVKTTNIFAVTGASVLLQLLLLYSTK